MSHYESEKRRQRITLVKDRNGWRPFSVWRDEVAPVLCFAAFIVLMFVVVTALSAKANAAPASPGEQFAHDHAANVCIALDEHPTIPGVIGLLAGLKASGLSDRESGVAIAESVINICPIHEGLLRQFVARYKTGRAA